MLLTFQLAAQSPIQFDNENYSLNIEDKMQYLLSSTTSKITDIRGREFEDLISSKNLKSNHCYWLKFKLVTTNNSNSKFCLSVSKFRNINLYKNDSLISKGGLGFPISDREINYKSESILEFEQKLNSTETYYIKIDSNSLDPFEYESIPFSLSTQKEVVKQGEKSRYYLLFFLGGIILMTLYNLALYWQIKESHYLYFVFHNLMILIFVLTQSGWLETYLIDHYKYHETLILVVGNFSMITYLLFATSILDFKKHNKKFYTFIMNFIWIWPLFLIPIFFGYQLISLAIGSILSIAVYNLVLIQTIKAIKRGSISAKYYLAGNVFLYLGTIFSVLMINNVLPNHILGFSPMEFVELGNLLELTLFSLTLGAAIQEMQQRLTTSNLQRKLAEETAIFKDQFLANMSHEIRTPLNGIIGMLDVYNISHVLTSKQKEQLGIVQYSAESLLAIINDILDLSKLQAGKMKLNPIPVDIQNFTHVIHQFFLHAANKKKIELKYSISPSVNNVVIFDEPRVKQVLNNLINNAIKFTDQGVIHIKVSSTSEHLFFEIIDSGIGIPKKDQDKLFQNFNQIDEANENRTDGTGLGLAICKQLVTLMNGGIGVRSNDDKGSTFFFTIPYVPSDEKIITSSQVNEFKKPEESLHILIVEDKPVNQKVVQLMLTNLGHTTEVANNGLQAVAIFEENKFDLILMDVQMPEMDGVEATQKIRKDFKKVPIILGLSANSMEGDAEKYIQLGFDDYLAKPITLKQLKNKINSFFIQE